MEKAEFFPPLGRIHQVLTALQSGVPKKFIPSGKEWELLAQGKGDICDVAGTWRKVLRRAWTWQVKSPGGGCPQYLIWQEDLDAGKSS